MSAVPDTRRYCPECQNWKLPIGAKWKRNADKTDWDVICRACRNRDDKRKGEEYESRQMSKLMQLTAGRILKGGNIPHTAELIGELIDVIGGTRKFAEEINRSRMMAEVGGMIRCQYDRAVIQLIKDNTAMGGARKPLDDMEIEELERELQSDIQGVVLRAYRESGDPEDDDLDEEDDGPTNPLTT